MDISQLRNVLRRYENNINNTQGQRRRQRKRTQSQSIRKVQQCTSNTIKSQRCKKRTAHTKKCWIHLAAQDNLRIKPSNIPNAGKGLFAWKKDFKKGSKISKYTGRRLNRYQIDLKYGDAIAEYAMCNGNKCIDANHTTDAAARFANDARKTGFRNNAILTGKNKFGLKAKSHIRPHQEVLTSYGDAYWEK
jgi:hypothetical protein